MSEVDLPRTFFLLHNVQRLLKRRFEAAAQVHELTLAQWRGLFVLAGSDGMSQTELAHLMESDPMTVSGLLERLEAKKMIKRSVHPADSRAKFVVITARARKLVAELAKVVRDIHDQALQGVGAAEKAAAERVLDQMALNLQAPGADYQEQVQ